jgi:putative flavoprotein involved in K+ transport
VNHLSKTNGRFTVSLNDQTIEAENAIVAMATYQEPRVPPFAGELSSDITQLHSREYRNPSQLREGDVLIVGAGNSGAEIALDVRTGREVWLAGRDVGEVPFDIAGRAHAFFSCAQGSVFFSTGY